MVWKVGEIAAKTGLSVRTLHYYEEVGLLIPSSRNTAGHRLYGQAALSRLLHIVTLRQLGLSLVEIRQGLDCSAVGLRDVLTQRVASLEREIAEGHRLRERLLRMTSMLAEPSLPSSFDALELLEMMVMFEKYYTPEQGEALEQRRESLGTEGMAEAEAAWQAIFAETKAVMNKGLPSTAPEMTEIRARAQALVAQFTGGDAEIHASLGKMWQEEAELPQQHGIDPEVMAFLWGSQV